MGSITGWLHEFQRGDPEAARLLWQRYFHRLQGVASARLPAEMKNAGHDEDVAQNALISFWQGIAKGQFAELASRDNLWRLLVVITARKVFHLMRDSGRRISSLTGEHAVEQLLSREENPQFASEAAEECDRLMATLGDPQLVQVARLRLEGCTNREVADRLQCSPRTIERKLLLIQALWAEEMTRE